jgi:hypothetical protein
LIADLPFRPDPLQQHVYGFILRVLRHKLAAERFGEDGLIEMIDQFAGASGFLRRCGRSKRTRVPLSEWLNADH